MANVKVYHYELKPVIKSQHKLIWNDKIFKELWSPKGHQKKTPSRLLELFLNSECAVSVWDVEYTLSVASRNGTSILQVKNGHLWGASTEQDKVSEQCTFCMTQYCWTGTFHSNSLSGHLVIKIYLLWGYLSVKILFQI